MRRLCRDGQWVLMANGLYATRQPDWMSHLWAGVLLGGDSAVVGGWAAAHLHGFAEAPSVIDIWSEGAARTGLRLAGPPEVVLHEGVRRGRGSPAITSAARTILDSVAGLSDDDVVGLVTRARRVSPGLQGRLRSELAAVSKVSHRALLTELVQPVNRGVESPLEWRFVRDVVKAHGLPKITLQVSHRRGTRSDASFDEFPLLVELDGFTWHGDRRDADQWRDNELLITSGRRTLRYGFRQIAGRPCEVAHQLARALSVLGWRGPLKRCTRCRRVHRY